MSEFPIAIAVISTFNRWRFVPGPVPVVSNPLAMILPASFVFTAEINPSMPGVTSTTERMSSL